ncbi:LOW QUALITY PROTEIN: cytochrome c oxidase assembly factor 1 homolog [Marmota marmota marmota]|uniref:LOW QUALITY PROTEIN: cytochrome c oxidase assembly factor 1 homolog n=1 Tax=Marmota marmota marmota TaxID=9994 RepID=UPI00209308F5|nr:LOW QUALITY PROTEIN: cytochrome c oxidase assembly factor 1 homolog [Marmota marmota marmota]
MTIMMVDLIGANLQIQMNIDAMKHQCGKQAPAAVYPSAAHTDFSGCCNKSLQEAGCPKPLGKKCSFTPIFCLTKFKKEKNNICLSYLEGFSRASFYQMPLEQLHSHPEVLEALSTPLHVHYLQPPSKHNFVDITVAWVNRLSL